MCHLKLVSEVEGIRLKINKDNRNPLTKIWWLDMDKLGS